MRAAVYHGRRDVRIEEVPIPVAGPGELLLRVGTVGIFGTDAHEFAAGPSLFPVDARHPISGHQGPLIPGHELSGTVVEVGAGIEGFAPGMLVVTGAGVSCGECHWCRRGSTNLCASYSTVGLQRDGGLAGFVAVPSVTCIDVGPYGLSADTAALAQPMSIAVHAMRRGRLELGDGAGNRTLNWVNPMQHHPRAALIAAAEVLGIGRSRANELVRRGVWPTKVLQLRRRLRPRSPSTPMKAIWFRSSATPTTCP
jgi:D-arabinose 1-dehydrogenase-like Zn-dependent alcohol dehydrogenase